MEKKRNFKQSLLKHGLQKGFYTIEEFCYCMNGNNIKIYEDYTQREQDKLPIEKFTSSENKLEETINEDTTRMMLENAGALW